MAWQLTVTDERRTLCSKRPKADKEFEGSASGVVPGDTLLKRGSCELAVRAVARPILALAAAAPRRSGASRDLDVSAFFYYKRPKRNLPRPSKYL
jgi:hypothetical protein